VPAVLSIAFGGALIATTPANAAPEDFSITSPTANQKVASRDSITVSGTGTSGSIVNVLLPDGSRFGGKNTSVQNGRWSITGSYSADAASFQTLNANQSTGFSGDGTASIRFQLPSVVNLKVASPTQGQDFTSRTFPVSGTGNAGNIVTVVDASGSKVTPNIIVGENDSWSGTVTLPDTAARNQKLTFSQIDGGAGRGQVTVDVTIPTPVNLVVTSPKNGDTTASNTVTFTGTGNPGNIVNILDADGNKLVTPYVIVDENGNWTADVTFDDDAARAQTVRVTQIDGASGRGDVRVTFNLPADEVVPPVTQLDAPVIVHPEDGQTIREDTVTIDGTGTPGAYVVVAVATDSFFDEYSTDLRNLLLAAVEASNPALADQMSLLADEDASAAAEPTPLDEPILVGADGTWTVTVALEDGSYTAAALQVAADMEAGTVSAVSGYSNQVDFIVAPALVPAPAGAGTVPSNASGTSALPETGSNDAGLIGLAAALTLAGGLLVALRRKRALNN